MKEHLKPKKFEIFFCAFRGDSRIVKRSKSGLTHPRETKIIFRHTFFWKICVQNFMRIVSVVLEIFTFLSWTDRQTNKRITTIYEQVGLFYCLKKLPPLLTTLHSFASFAGGLKPYSDNLPTDNPPSYDNPPTDNPPTDNLPTRQSADTYSLNRGTGVLI